MVEDIDVSYLKPSKYQLRRGLGDISSLVRSISERGVLQPVLVRPLDNGYFEIVCGHRRFAACKKLKLKHLPCTISHLSDKDAFEASIVENVQRENLDPIDEAQAYRRYVLEFGWGSITKLAQRIGKSEVYVSHRLLLLNLPAEVRSKIADRSLSTSKARELVWLKSPELQKDMMSAILDRKLSSKGVHEAVTLVKQGVKVGDAVEAVDNQVNSWKSYKEERPDPDSVLMERAIVSLIISMMRLDNLIDLAKNEQFKEYLISTRYDVHQLIDRCLRKKKEMWGR